MSFTTRPARPGDHAAFERLFPELAVEDPPISQEKWASELMPTTLMVEDGNATDPSEIVGYAYYQIMKDVAYIRHVVTAPHARKRGVGRALMAEIANRARAAGCTAWCLNVKPENTAAIALYERVGLARAFGTRVLRVPWSLVGPATEADTAFTARLLGPDDDARVEPPMLLVDGQLAVARKNASSVLLGLFDRDMPVGATVIHPEYPSVYPFRVVRPDLAFVLLRAARAHVRPADAHIVTVVEGQPEVAQRLLDAGATLELDIVHMKGALAAS